MEKYRVKIKFGKDHSQVITVEGENKEQVLYYLTGHKDWYYALEDECAINMQLVTDISFVKKAKVSSKNELGL